MAFYPMYIDIEGKKCIVVGGGDVAERKVKQLVECNAKIKVVSPKLTDELKRLQQEGKIEVELRNYQAGDIDEAILAIVATDDKDLNKNIYQEATEKKIQVNVVDAPELCTFIVPSIIRRGDLIISISTSGSCPALAKKIREKLEEDFSEEYAQFCDILKEFRAELADRYEKQEERAEALRKAIDSETLELIKKGKLEKVKERVRSCI